MTTEIMLLAIAIPIFYLTMFGESMWIHKIHPEYFLKNMGIYAKYDKPREVKIFFTKY